ncbi:MAG: M16 family metallopeptidase, partial [Opitutales bacterium]
VNFKQTDFADNSVQVAATFGLGRLGMNEAQQGLDLLASRTFVRGGLQEHDWEEIQRVLAAENVGVSFSVQEDAFYLGGETTPEDFQRQLQLMTAYLSDPAYREESLRNARNSFEQLYVSLAHTPEGVYADRVERFLLNGHWHAGFPPSQRLMMYTMEDVQALLAGPLESAYLEVSIVGDIDWETARPAILRTFGALPERSKTAPRRPEPKVAFPRPVDLAEFEFSSEIPKGRAMVFWPTTDMREDISQSRRLNVLSRMLGDRLRVKVREELGEGYSPYARHSGSEIYPDYGYLVMTNTAAPERLRENAELLATVGNSVAQTPFTEDELTRSLDPLLSFLEEYHRDNSYWLNRVLVGSQARPELLDWARSMQKDYESIRLSDINALAEKYLGGKRDLTVLIAPKPPAASSEATEDEEEQRDGDSSAASQAPSANTEEGDGPSEETEDDAA